MSTRFLPYDLASLFQETWSGVATFERDFGEPDAYGGEGRPDWQSIGNVDCLLVWNKSTGAHAAQRTYVSPDRKVPMSEGFLICPAGTDVTENDRIIQVQFHDGTLIDGLFIIDAVLQQDTHVEVYIDRSHLGP
jgi:hypothetical protein